jgi:hypothetical protein
MSGQSRWLRCSPLILIACSESLAPSPARAHLATGVAASVASDSIAPATVQRIAQAERVTPQVARARAITDALFAAGAREAFQSRPVLSVVERAALARALLEDMKSDALAGGPPTDVEVAELTALRWRELDRPASSRTTHAVAIVEKPEDEAAALEIAQRIHAAVRGVTDPDEFLRLATAVPHVGIEVRAERLPPVTPDGRVFDPAADRDQAFDPGFAAVATRLAVGEISEPTKTRFGYHVILCEARIPEQRLPLAQRRELLRDEVLKRRAERAKQELLARLSAALPVEISRAADDLTSQVSVSE